MSDDASPAAPAGPKPGSATAFRQRREAYDTAALLPDQVAYARVLLTTDMPRAAAAQLQGAVAALDDNPEARRIIALRHPGLAEQALDTFRTADRTAGRQVDTVERGEWRSSAGVETQVEVGRSARGWHSRVHVATPGYENDPAWSAAFPTRAAAEEVARGREEREHGDERRYSGPPTPRGRHAAALGRAGDMRRASAEAAREGDHRTAALERAGARASLDEAVGIRSGEAAWVGPPREMARNQRRADQAPGRNPPREMAMAR